MAKRTLRNISLFSVVTSVGLSAAVAVGQAQAPAPRGTATVYGAIRDDQVEQLSTPERIKAVAAQGSPTAIWQTLEHGEKVECLDCISTVEPLLYHENAKAREISAWWLRRRIFGVFGAGEAYPRLMQTLQSDPSETKRAYAAEALGEFLEEAGIAPVATSLTQDKSPLVRAAAARALDRLNSEGPEHALSKALGDGDENVRLAALNAAQHVHGFQDVDGVTARLSDPSPAVRRHAASTLGAMRARGAVSALLRLTSPQSEADARTRAEAVFALGMIGDSAAQAAVLAAEADPDTFVQDAARQSARKL